MARGRPALGPKLVWGLEGSDHAKARLAVIIGTLTGDHTVSDACAELGLGQAAFFKLRAKALEGALRNLEPKPMGRPPKLTTEEDRRIAELEEELRQHRLALQAAHVNEELALTMPFLAQRLKLERDLKRLRGGKGRRKRSPSGRGSAGHVGTRCGASGRSTSSCPGLSQGETPHGTDQGGDGGEGDDDRDG
jgi:transposase